MTDISLAEALLLWDSATGGQTPRFAVRPLGHEDYHAYTFANGACYAWWRALAEKPKPHLLAKALVELWHIVAFYRVPPDMVHEAMLVVPEYREMLADDCLPQRFRHEREA